MRTRPFSIGAEELILAVNPGHDGSIVALRDGNLLFSIEAEHDSHPRHTPASAYLLLDAMGRVDEVPAVVATSGWGKHWSFQSASTPYEGIADHLVKIQPGMIFGHETLL